LGKKKKREIEKVKMKEEGQANPSLCNIQKGYNKNLCISSEDAKQSEEESWSIVIYEKGMAREMRGVEMSAISNEEELVQTMWAQGKVEDEIAGVLGIDVWMVHEYVERLERDDRR
jgi:DNA-binding CsgD family transcriptional regulator